MTAFDVAIRTQVSFGIGRSRQVGEDVKRLSGQGKAVLVTDPGLVQAGVAGDVVDALRESGVEAELFAEVQSDPTSDSIDRAADIIRQSGAACVIGLGGGSAMDVAKMAAMVAGDRHPAEHYALMAHPFAPKRVATIMIPTTSGTGAEVTSTVVFSTAEKRKVWGWDRDLAPDLAILDPALTVKLPPHLTAATGLDALVHAMEAAAGKRRNPVIHGLGMKAIQLISRHLLQAIREPGDLEARGSLSVGAMLAGLAIEQGGTGIAHCIGHALGTLARIHHGRAVAIALYHAYAWNVEAAVEVHAEIARALGVHDTWQDERALAYAGAEAFARLVESTGLNLSLKDDGLSLADQDRLVEVMQSVENAPMRQNNCRDSTTEDLRRLAEAILSR